MFEDLHWADDSTLALVEAMLELADREAAVLVLLFRSERRHGSWHLGEVARQRFPHRLVEVELRLLAEAESKLLASRAAGAELPSEVSALLAARSGGNPFFLEEALRDLIERDVLRPVNGHWELTVAPDEVTVPLLVQETLQARLDRLEQPTREVANVASVIGRTFGLPLLERLLSRDELLPALSELLRLDLVVEERRRPVPRVPLPPWPRPGGRLRVPDRCATASPPPGCRRGPRSSPRRHARGGLRAARKALQRGGRDREGCHVPARGR